MESEAKKLKQEIEYLKKRLEHNEQEKKTLFEEVTALLGKVGEAAKRRKEAEEALRKAHDELEMQVQERTRDLAKANEALKADITERKRAEEALRASEEKHKALIETTNTGYLILDTQGRVIDGNKEYIRLTGYDTLEEVLGRRVVEWTAPHDQERNAAEVKKCAEQGYIRNLEIDYVNRSGQITPIEINATVVGSGDSARILSLCRDITERKMAEETLHNERLLLRTLIDNIPDSIYSKDLACRKTLANLAEVHWVGAKSEAEVLGKDDFEVYPKELAERFFADDQSVIQSGKPVLNREEYILDEKEQKRWLLSSKLPLRDKDNQIIGLVGIGRDITERKLAEEELHRKEEHHKAVIESIFKFVPEGVLVLTESLNLLKHNKAFDNIVQKYAPLLGYTEEELAEKITEQLRSKIATGDAAEIRIMKKNQ